MHRAPSEAPKVALISILVACLAPVYNHGMETGRCDNANEKSRASWQVVTIIHAKSVHTGVGYDHEMRDYRIIRLRAEGTLCSRAL